MKASNQLPYNSRNMDMAGQHHGKGLSTNYGKKKGTYEGSQKIVKDFGSPPRKY